jgi:hypothetical protein
MFEKGYRLGGLILGQSEDPFRKLIISKGRLMGADGFLLRIGLDSLGYQFGKVNGSHSFVFSNNGPVTLFTGRKEKIQPQLHLFLN